MDRGLFGTFDYDRDYLQPEMERKEHDPDEWIFRGGQWIYVGDEQPMEVQCYENDAYWRKRYQGLCYEMGEIVNEQQDKIISLSQENKRLRREIRNMRQTKRRRR